MLRLAINGFGRIGRNVLRALYESGRNQFIQVVAINEIADPDGMAHLLKYDTSHGRFACHVERKGEQLTVAGDVIRLCHQTEITGLPWAELGVDIVLECTGQYTDKASGLAHIEAGAKKVLFSQPGAPDMDNTIIYGCNEDTLLPEHKVVSNGS